MYGFNRQELSILKKLDTPKKIQDFLDTLKINFEPNGDTCRSPRVILRTRSAHCIEGAMLAATALRIHGHRALVLDLTSSYWDQDHVIAIFKKDSYWGAISKSNHATLRYREPVYKTIRELVMSYFNEYIDNKGKKTLRSYSNPVDLSRFDKFGWTTSQEDVWYVAEHLLNISHNQILTKSQTAGLRKADPIEIKAGELVEYKSK